MSGTGKPLALHSRRISWLRMTATSPGLSAPIMLGGTLKRQTLRKDWYLAWEPLPCDWRECSNGSYYSLETPSVFTAEGILKITTACTGELCWGTPLCHTAHPKHKTKHQCPGIKSNILSVLLQEWQDLSTQVLQQPVIHGQWVEQSIYNDLKFTGFLNISCFSNHQLKPKPNKNQSQSHGTNQVYGG